MGAVYFYHLTRQPLEHTLPVLLEKALQAGWSVEVRGRDSAMIEQLDQDLWKSPEDAFLPHAISDGVIDASTPIILGQAPASPKRECIILVGGAEVTPDEIADAQRVCVLFDGHDNDAVSLARQHWKYYTDAGCVAQYWSEESGRWAKKAESGATNQSKS
ncbi:MAG: DNA polymerase III subunit chi [Rhodobacteraceae bacterium]|jgi:DNA polymerase-3 subunit chi|nr:DNA polymerase III subunit chi [Paracoccaceae bacterium]